jgi:hypothetical protein
VSQQRVPTTIFTQWRIIRFFAFILQSGGAATGKSFSLPGNSCDTTNRSLETIHFIHDDALLTPAAGVCLSLYILCLLRRRGSEMQNSILDAKNGVTPSFSMSLRKPSHTLTHTRVKMNKHPTGACSPRGLSFSSFC